MGTGKLNLGTTVKDITNPTYTNSAVLTAWGKCRNIEIELKTGVSYSSMTQILSLDVEDRPSSNRNFDLVLYQGVSCRCAVVASDGSIRIVFPNATTITNAFLNISYLAG